MGLPELQWPGLYGASNLASSTGEVLLSHGYLNRANMSELETRLPDNAVLVCVHLSGKIWFENEADSTRYREWGTPGSANIGVGGVSYLIRYHAEDCQFARFLLAGSIFQHALGEDYRRESLEFIDPQNRPTPALASIAKRAVELRADIPANRLLADSIGYAIAAELLTSWSNQSERIIAASGAGSQHRLCMQQVAEYVEANLYRQISLAELVGISRLSLPHFMRVFKAEFGIPPYRWVMVRKIEHAKILMRERSISITEISHLLDFSSLQHFSSAFRKQCGVSPSQFREIVKPDQRDY